MVPPELDGPLDRSVSLIIAVRNEGAHIDACLTSIRAQAHPRDLLEILVVDGMSTDATRSIVQLHMTADGRIRLLDNPQQGMPYGLNIGIEHAKGRYIGAVTGHSMLPADYVTRAIAALDDTGAWSVGGRISRVAKTPMQEAIAIATSSRFGVGDSRHNYAEAPGWVETAFPGFWPREVFDIVGPFDPEMVVNEDNELSLRIRKAGGRIWYDPSIEVSYSPRSSLPALFTQYRRYAAGKLRVLRKHRGGLGWRHLVPAAWVGFLVGGGLGALRIGPLAWIWLAGIAGYLGAVVVVSVARSTLRARWWRVAGSLMTLHVAYGLGTWQGLFTLLARALRR